MRVFGAIMDDKRLERLEEQTRAMAHARGPLALTAHDTAQLFQHEVDAGGFVAARNRLRSNSLFSMTRACRESSPR